MPPQLTGGAATVTGCWPHDSLGLVVMSVSRGMNAYWRVALDGSAFEPLAPPAPGGYAVAAGSFGCTASPDGQALIILRFVNQFTELVRFDLRSHRETPVTVSPSDKYDAAWSPDGRWIAFAANTGGTVNIWRVPVAGGEEQQLTTGFERMRHLFYSPDGRWLYIQPNHRNIYRMPADGGPRRAVTHFPESSSLILEEPTISPDGRYLVYNRGHGGSSVWMLTLNVP
jgi:Tol biopolymer transport system component